jgi:hypothetical protein
MRVKSLLFFSITLLAIGASAQNKVFSFSQIQSRNDIQQWRNAETICEQSVHFTANEINLTVDKSYHLTIISKTDLPDKGVIYLCNDEKSNPVTVMLIDNIKMYLYSKTKRYLIHFDPVTAQNNVADTD